MSPRAARTLRHSLGLPRLPKLMDAVQRLSYRHLKRRYIRLPAPARRLFLTNCELLRGSITSST